MDPDEEELSSNEGDDALDDPRDEGGRSDDSTTLRTRWRSMVAQQAPVALVQQNARKLGPLHHLMRQ